MHKNQIRVKTGCLFISDGKVLVSTGYDKVAKNNFYRLLGGSVEFSETAEQGIRREIREELQSEIEHLTRLDIVENLFEYEGNPGHEIFFIFSGDLSDKSLYERDRIHIVDGGYEFDAVWVSIGDILNRETPLYPALDYSNFLK